MARPPHSGTRPLTFGLISVHANGWASPAGRWPGARRSPCVPAEEARRAETHLYKHELAVNKLYVKQLTNISSLFALSPTRIRKTAKQLTL